MKTLNTLAFVLAVGVLGAPASAAHADRLLELPEQLTLGVDFGVRLAGRGEFRQEIAGNDLSADYVDESGMTVSAHALWSLGQLSVGGRVAYATRVEVDPEDASDFEFGTALDLRGRVEVPVPLADKLSLRPFGEVGIFFINPQADFEDLLDAASLDKGSRSGLVAALGLGLSYDIDVLVLRVDLLIDFHRAKLVDDDVGLFRYEMELTGSRVWTQIGIEF